MVKFSGNIRGNVVTTIEDFYRLEGEWNLLLRHIPGYLPTMTFQWQRAWLEVNQDQILKLHIFVFKDHNDRLIGVLPFVRTQARILMKKLNVYTFSGARDQIQTLIVCNQEHQIPILLKLLAHFYDTHRDWDLLTLRRLSASRADDIYLERILKKYRWPFSVESHLRVPYIRLQGDFSTYLKGRNRHFRHEIKRKTNRLRKMGELSYQAIEAPLNAEDFQQFLELEDAGWKGKNKSSLKHRPHLHGLFKKLSLVNTPQLKLIQFKLLLDGQLISASLCLQTMDGLHVMKIAYDERFKKQSPGLLLRLYEIEYAFERGLKLYDFSGKEQRWMRAFTSRSHHVMDYIIYRKTFVALIRYLGFTRFRPIIKLSPFSEHFLKHLIKD
ncbi:GNAT family N-acetyltransferase [Calditrichota bacterium LG25]